MESPSPANGVGDHLLRTTPPQDREAETIVLALILVHPEKVIDVVAPLLKVSDFYLAQHGICYAEMLALHAAREPIEPMTVLKRIVEKGAERSKVAAFLTRLTGCATAPENAAYWAQRIVNKARERGTIIALASSVQDMTSGTASTEERLDQAERKVFEATKARHEKTRLPLSGAMRETFDQLYARQEGKVIGVRSGYSRLDEMTNGFVKKELSLVAARPGRGKTSFLVNLLRNSCDPNLPTGGLAAAFFALEMSVADVNLNLLCSLAGVDTRDARSGHLPSGLVSALEDAAAAVERWRIHYFEATRLTVQDVRSRLRLLRSEGGCDIAFVDYLQLMSAPTERKNRGRHEEVAEVSRGLKEIAMELDMPIVAAAQLNRNAEGARPKLSDLRESGSLEQDPALVIFLHQEEETTGKETEYVVTGPMQLLIPKNRFGPVGDVTLIYDKAICQFREPNQ